MEEQVQTEQMQVQTEQVQMEQMQIQENINIYPIRLVMIKSADNCMFCENPKGYSLSTYVDYIDKLGYICCAPCESKMNEAVKFWYDTLCYGRALYLKDIDISIRRSSGDIESDWKVNNDPCVKWDFGLQKEIVNCANDSKKLMRWCILDDILELNPEKEKEKVKSKSS